MLGDLIYYFEYIYLWRLLGFINKYDICYMGILIIVRKEINK